MKISLHISHSFFSSSFGFNLIFVLMISNFSLSFSFSLLNNILASVSKLFVSFFFVDIVLIEFSIELLVLMSLFSSFVSNSLLLL